ncbi:hypothetical protein J23TS9_52540 [Paenibacillus sp. J23TS9]|nr:hypothetical protein J23TS9_52540 [Paenibacillus sp. J23TS9]
MAPKTFIFPILVVGAYKAPDFKQDSSHLTHSYNEFHYTIDKYSNQAHYEKMEAIHRIIKKHPVESIR